MRVVPVVFTLLVVFASLYSAAQLPPGGSAPLMFEVASIKERTASAGGGYAQSPDRFIRINSSLRDLMEYAYDLQRFQIVGGPDWLTSTRFDVNAKAAFVPTTDQMRTMVQRLLAERFRLKVSAAMRDMPVYLLRVARGDGRLGRLMTKTTVDCAAVEADRQRTGASAPTRASAQPNERPLCTSWLVARPGPNGLTVRYQASGTTSRELAGWLSPYAGRAVLDRTNLTGDFDVELSFAPPAGPSATPAAGEEPVTVFTAVEEQLGLMLDSDRGQVEVLVIDSVARPTPD
jgi:uncharacterized protein (TIGR03435 family)